MMMKSVVSKVYGMKDLSSSKNRFVNFVLFEPLSLTQKRFSQTSSNQNRQGRRVMRKKVERRGRGRSILDMI